jgi:hypothetical protein
LSFVGEGDHLVDFLKDETEVAVGLEEVAEVLDASVVFRKAGWLL